LLINLKEILSNEIFRQARKDLNLALAKITHMEANYNDVVPRRDFVQLEAKSNGYLERIKELQGTHESQAREIEQLHTQNEYKRFDFEILISNFI